MYPTENSPALKGQVSIAALIRSEFPTATLAEIKALTATDREELASAIARMRGLSTEQLSFTPTAY